MLNRRTNVATLDALDRLPGLTAELEVDGMPTVHGSLVDVTEGRMVIDVRSASKAALLAAATTARLTVDAPAGCRFVTTAGIATTDAGRISITVAESPQLVRRSA